MRKVKNPFHLKILESDEKCPIHGVNLKYIPGHKPFCELCQVDKNNAEVQKMQDNLKVNLTRGYLKSESLVDRSEAYDYTFSTFKALSGSREAKAKGIARHIAGLYLKYPNKKFNSLFFGTAGAGKTHLAMSILNAVNDNSKNPMQKCLFLSVNKLIREMKNWFNDKYDNEWSPKHVTDVVHGADLVVLDDLGAESANNEATTFVQDTIFDIYESNQRIITTSNLNMNQLRRTYHDRLVSRIQEGGAGHIIDFSEIKDKRLMR